MSTGEQRKNGKNAGKAGGSKIAALHVQGDRAIVLVGERDGDRVRVSATSIPEKDAARLAEQGWMASVGHVVRVIPGGETIARVAMVPQADGAAMASAAGLLAEVQLPDSIPVHRRGAGVLAGHGEASQFPALMVGWKGASDPTCGFDEDVVKETFCPIIGALAVLRGTSSSSAWFADPSDGSISMLAGTGLATSARVVIEDNSSSVLWAEGVVAAVGEELEGGDMKPRLGLGAEEMERTAGLVSGVEVTREWVDVNGAALGALLAVMQGDPTTGTLALMRARPPKVVEHPVMRIATWLGEKKRAMWVSVACLVLVVGAPIAIAWGRVTILDSKSQSLKKANETRKALDERGAVYAELKKTRWPITKLLSDISQATPLGVEITSLTIDPDVGSGTGGASQGISLNAIADTRVQMNELQANLNKAGVFTSVTPGRSESTADGRVQFDMKFGVSNATAAVAASPEWDWAAKNIAVRLHGEGASLKTPPVGKGGDAASSGSSRRASRGDADDAPSKPAADKKEAGGVPPELKDEQIAKMDRVTAMREFSSRRKYSQTNPSLDASTKRRLEEEVGKLQERMKAAGAAGGKAGG